ncbi:MAG TPA: helical backbone metal receptor [Aggregatilinea sp.]|uniref:helical backbone metal receptor n=1 Tax=Aggregatilinea sp. TaxID=2806333 RepID=UPI002BE00DAF|nr:helical backbone metal receptor [Aggregatilinea sp.]HML21780.1 helical backbone metal receptor [Aggregatilinea sp.]
MDDAPQSDSPPEAYHWQFASPVDFVPQRVVSLVPSLTESLFDLDLGQRLVGVTAYCVRPLSGVQLLPRVGGTKNPDIEAIVRLGPDLVLMNDEENRREDAESLQAADIPVWVTGPRSIADVLNLLWTIMDVFDHTVMVPRVHEIERAYDYTLAATRNAPLVPTFAPIWRDPWMTFNADTYAHDVLRVCGGVNVFADRERQFPLAADLGEGDPLPADDPQVAGRDRRYPRISLDEVVAAQPELVLLPDEPYAFTAENADAIRALDIPAARSGRVHLIDGSLLTWHGTRAAYALRDLPALILGE